MLLEGNVGIKPKCAQPWLPNCYNGSAWTEMAQQDMAGPLPGNATVNVTDAWHNALDGFHDHEAQYVNATKPPCNASSPDNCTVDVLTYTSNYYGRVNKYTKGMVPVGAHEV